MSTRCKCCNTVLFDTEMAQINEKTGLSEDMCGKCRAGSYNEFNHFEDHEYTLGGLREGLTQALESKY
jgi:hypothetical protein